ncbi:D-alanyl-D-alanine carboxypeptidase [Clostridiales Family XIII bacterium PM5-7]
MNGIMKLTAATMMAVMITSTAAPVVKAKSYLGSGKVQITWSTSEGVDTYKVYRSKTKTGKYTRLKTVKANQTMKCIDYGRTIGSSYYYKVVADGKSSSPVKVTVKGARKTDPKNPLMLVNKQNWLSSSYVPTGLTSLGSYAVVDIKAKKSVKTAYGKLYNAAKKKGYTIKVTSAYRSYALQKELFDYWTRVDGLKQALRTSAKPGRSEHQTGYALDVTCAKVGWDLVERFGSTAEGKWIAKNAHKYGFIVRYGKTTENITGYAYEPWHLRYVGVTAATEIYKANITLEEYLGY